jgi:hypothetical protein
VRLSQRRETDQGRPIGRDSACHACGAGIRLTCGHFHRLPWVPVLHHGHTTSSRPSLIRVVGVCSVVHNVIFFLTHHHLSDHNLAHLLPTTNVNAPIDARRAQHAA